MWAEFSDMKPDFWVLCCYVGEQWVGMFWRKEVESDLAILGLSKGHLSMLVLLLENI